MKLSGARVVVTGASRGIGAALATELAARGARVVLVARSVEPLEKLAAELGGEAFPADLALASGIEPLVHRIEADGPIDVLVNNAGLDLTGDLVALPTDEIARLLAVNLCAPMLLCRAVIPGMRSRGRGHIVNVSSLSGTNALPGLAPYSASKAGLSHFTAALRAELKGTPITTTLAQSRSRREHDDRFPARAPADASRARPARTIARLVRSTNARRGRRARRRDSA